MGMDECYGADPVAASAQEGSENLAILTDFIVEAVEELLQGKVSDNKRGIFGR
jgi:hypothetical protein